MTNVLAQVLHGVISQTLVKTAEGRGCKAIVEILRDDPCHYICSPTTRFFRFL